ncbi:MAG: phage portal protein [Parasphingorhabdus sp.]|uniref:phage portal protein n=1 Tax=Alphaproteobacteria TaxID=28211 RepID=UPI003263208B
MGILSPINRLARRVANLTEGGAKDLRLTEASGWAEAFGRNTASGKTVNLENSLQLSAVWACINRTSQTVSSLPLKLYVKEKDGSRSPYDGRLSSILSKTPNQDQTPLEFWEGNVGLLLSKGNAYSEIVRTGREVSELLPMEGIVRPVRTEGGVLQFEQHVSGKRRILSRDQVFHLKGFGFGGDEGLSAIRYGAQTMGASIAAEDSAARLFANGMQMSGILQSDQILKAEQRKQISEMMAQYTGSDKAGKLMVLEAGLKYQSVTMNPEDAQMLETRRFNVEDICRWFGIPPIVIGHAAEGQTMWGTGVEQILLSWLNLGLNPLLKRIEQRINKQLIAPSGLTNVYAEFNREGMLQMDSTAKAAFLSQMVNNGIYSRDEARETVNRQRRGGAADELMAQTAMAPLGSLGQPEG